MQKMSVAEIYGIPILSTSIAFELGTVACPCVMFLIAEVYHQYIRIIISHSVAASIITTIQTPVKRKS